MAGLTMTTGMSSTVEGMRPRMVPRLSTSKHRQQISATDLTTVTRPMSAPCTSTGLIKIRYGDNRVALFNSKCQSVHLIQSMKRRCQIRGANLDLMNWKTGELQHMTDKLTEMAYNSLKERETYIVVKIIEDESQSNPQYIPLVDNLDQSNPELALKIHDLSKPQAKQIRAKWTTISKKGLSLIGAKEGTTDSKERSSKSINSMFTSKVAANTNGNKLVGLLAVAYKHKEQPLEAKPPSAVKRGKLLARKSQL